MFKTFKMSRKLTKEQWASIKKEQRMNRLKNFYTMETPDSNEMNNEHEIHNINKLQQNSGFKIIDTIDNHRKSSALKEKTIDPLLLNKKWENFKVQYFIKEPGELPEYFKEREAGVNRVFLNEKYFDMEYEI